MKERKRTSVLQSARADGGDGMRRPPGHLITSAGREEVMRKGGGEEVRSVRCMCDVCAAHGDRAAVGVDVDAQGSGLSRMPRVCIGKNPGWFALACRKGGSIPRFPDEPVGKEDVEVRSEGAHCEPPRT